MCIRCDLDVHAFLLRSLSPSQVLAFHGLSFLQNRRHGRLTCWSLLQHNLLFGCAFLESFTHQQSSKRQNFRTYGTREASRKACLYRISDFQRPFFRMSSALYFFLVLCSFLTKLLEINLAFFFHGLEISNRGRENVSFFRQSITLQSMYLQSFYTFPPLAKKPYSASI